MRQTYQRQKIDHRWELQRELQEKHIQKPRNYKSNYPCFYRHLFELHYLHYQSLLVPFNNHHLCRFKLIKLSIIMLLRNTDFYILRQHWGHRAFLDRNCMECCTWKLWRKELKRQSSFYLDQPKSSQIYSFLYLIHIYLMLKVQTKHKH